MLVNRVRVRMTMLGLLGLLPGLTGCHDVATSVLETIYLAFSIADVWV